MTNNLDFILKLDAQTGGGFKKLRDNIKKVKEDTKDTREEIEKLNDEKEKLGGNLNFKGFDKLKGKLSGVTDGFNNIKDSISGGSMNIMEMGEQILKLKNPLAIVGATIAAVGAGLGIVMYQTFQKIASIKKEMNLEPTEKSLDAIVGSAVALQKVIEGIDLKEVTKASKALSHEFGVNMVQAVDMVSQALVMTPNLDIDNITEYAVQFKALGLTSQQFLAQLVMADKNGWYMDKGADTVKEFGLRLREGAKATVDAIKGLGVDSKKLYKDLNSGAITQAEAMKQITDKMKTASMKERQTAIADIFGAPGEDLGFENIIKMAESLGMTLDEQIAKATGLTKQRLITYKIEQQIGAQQSRNVSFLEKSAVASKKYWTEVRLEFEKWMQPVYEATGEFMKYIQESLTLKVIWIVIKETFLAIFNIIKWILGFAMKLINIIVAFSDAFLDGLIEITKMADNLMSNIFGKSAWDGFKQGFENIFFGIIHRFQYLFDYLSASMDALASNTKALFGNKEAKAKAIADNKRMKEAVEGFWSTKQYVDKTVYATTKYDKKNEGGTGEKGGYGTGTGTSTDPNMSKVVENSVTGATSEVKHITINLDSLQRITTQNLNSNADVKNMKDQLLQALAGVLNDSQQSSLI